MSSPLPQLKPMSAGDILDQAIRLYRQNFVGLVTIVAIVSLPVILFQALAVGLALPFSQDLNTPPNIEFSPVWVLLAVGYGVLLFVASILGIIERGALTSYVSERFLGRPITVKQAYGNAFRRGLSLILAAILLGLAFIGTFGLLLGVGVIPLFFGVLATGTESAGPLGALAGLSTLCLCLFFIPTLLGTIYLYMRWSFWNQAIMIENYNSTGGLGRSWKLVKGSFWRVLGFNILLSIMVYFLTVGPVTALSLGTIFFPSPILRFILQSIVGGVIGILVAPLQYATLTILYYDLRIRHEGFDLQLQLQEQDTTPDLPSLIPGNLS